MIGSAILGFIGFPVIPITYEYACELAFPIGEGAALGYLIGFSSIISSCFSLIFGAII